jgi:hypothetical protein
VCGAGDTVRVAARLVDVENGAQLGRRSTRVSVEHLLAIEGGSRNKSRRRSAPYGLLFERNRAHRRHGC